MPSVCKPNMAIDVISTSKKCRFLIFMSTQFQKYIGKALISSTDLDFSSLKVTSIWHRNNIDKSTWKNCRYFISFDSRTYVKLSTWNQCHLFDVDLPFIITEILMKLPRGISTWNWWLIYEDDHLRWSSNIYNHLRYFKMEWNHFEKVHRNEITSKRDGQTTLIFKLLKTYKPYLPPRSFAFQ